MPMTIATAIPTDDWNRIISGLMADGWRVISKYDEFDAGIDFDFVILRKDNEKILLGWDNWVEGEIKCSETRMTALSTKFGIAFSFGEPVNLMPSVIRHTVKQNLRTRWAKQTAK